MPGLYVVAAEEGDVHGEFLEKHLEAERIEPWFSVHRRRIPGTPLSLALVETGIFGAPRIAEDDRRLAMVDGEFLNATAIRQELAEDIPDGDAHLVLPLAAQGPVAEWAPRLRGAFTFLLWDGETRELSIAGDRYGIRPHHLAFDGRRFVLGPTLRFVLGFPWVSRDLDTSSLLENFAFQTMFENRTFFRGIRAVPEASILTLRLEPRGLTTEKYWTYGGVEKREDITFEETVEESTRLLVRAVERRIVTPHRYGIPLSGGLDSRLLVAVLRERVRPLHAFTFGTENCRDLAYAAEICRRSGIRHHRAPFHSGAWLREIADDHVRLVEGNHALLHAHGLHMVKLMREHVDVIHSGLFGEAVVGGYYLFRQHLGGPGDPTALVAPHWRRDTKSYGRAFPDGIDLPRLFAEAIRPSPTAAREALAHALEGYRSLPLVDASTAFALAHRTRRLLIHMLVFSRPWVEDRTPFADEDLFDFVRSTPARYRLGFRLQEAMLERLAPDLSAIPLTRTDRPPTRRFWPRRRWLLGRWLRRGLDLASGGHRGRQATKPYTTYGPWLREDLRDWVRSILLDERTLARGVFDPAFVRETVEAAGPPTRPWTWRIGLMLSFELTMRHLADDAPST